MELEFKARRLDKSLCVGFDLANSDGVTVLRSYQTDSREENWPTVRIGCNRWRCKIPRGLLNGGTYLVNPRISIHNVAWIVHEDAILEFRVNLRHGVSPFWSSISEENRPGSDGTYSRLDLVEPLIRLHQTMATKHRSPSLRPALENSGKPYAMLSFWTVPRRERAAC